MRRIEYLPEYGPQLLIYTTSEKAGVMISGAGRGFLVSGCLFGQGLAIGWYARRDNVFPHETRSWQPSAWWRRRRMRNIARRAATWRID